MDDRGEIHLFNLAVSRRYSNKLRGKWTFIANTTNLLAFAAAAGAAIAVAFPPHVFGGFPIPLSALLAIISALSTAMSLVFHPGVRAEEHQSRVRDYARIEIDFRRGRDDIEESENRKLEVDVTEPGQLRVLYAICYNEQIVAQNFGNPIQLNLSQRVFARFLDISPAKLRDPATA